MKTRVVLWVAVGLLTLANSAPGFAQEEYGPPAITGKSKKVETPVDGKRNMRRKTPTPKAKPLVIPEGMQGPVAFVADKDHDWGTILQGTNQEHTFQIENKGDMLLQITNVKPG